MALTEEEKAKLRQKTNARMAGFEPADVLDAGTGEVIGTIDETNEYTPAGNGEEAWQESIQSGQDALDEIRRTSQNDFIETRHLPAVYEDLQPLLYGLDPDDYESEQMAFTYIGVVPKSIDGYCNRWLECIGAGIAPNEGEVESFDQETRTVRADFVQWNTPLFKLDRVDDETGQHIVLKGGGRQGFICARSMTRALGVGDFDHPVRLYISQEARTGINRNTGASEPRRMYRFIWIDPQNPYKGKYRKGEEGR